MRCLEESVEQRANRSCSSTLFSDSLLFLRIIDNELSYIILLRLLILNNILCVSTGGSAAATWASSRRYYWGSTKDKEVLLL